MGSLSRRRGVSPDPIEAVAFSYGGEGASFPSSLVLAVEREALRNEIALDVVLVRREASMLERETVTLTLGCSGRRDASRRYRMLRRWINGRPVRIDIGPPGQDGDALVVDLRAGREHIRLPLVAGPSALGVRDHGGGTPAGGKVCGSVRAMHPRKRSPARSRER